MSYTRIVLSGPPGSGKSTVGPRLAEHLAWPYVDLDRAVEARAGRPVEEVFEREGEFAFRALERSVFEEALRSDPVVIAAGGGALVDRAWRRRVLECAAVVGLTAPVDVLTARLSVPPIRPLLTGDLRRALERLLDLRRDAYPEVHCMIDTSRVPADAAPAHILKMLDASVPVWLGERSYQVRFEAFEALGDVTSGRRCLVVSDRNVARHHRKRWTRALRRTLSGELVVPPGEPSKNLRTLRRIWKHALRAGLERDDLFVCIGGGVVSDLGGLAAATFLRGVRYVTVPTSTLAMLDASVGGKVAIDLPEGKNLVGTFHQPSGVLVDSSLLSTLPIRHHRAGLAEALKIALTHDEGLFTALASMAPVLAASPVDPALPAILRRAVALKATVVSRDERESGERVALNFGHTLGHALEAALGYRMLHGECVALGILAECALGEHLGVTPPELTGDIERIVATLGLPTRVRVPVDKVIAHATRDKKRTGGTPRVVLVSAPGCWSLHTVDSAALRVGLRRIVK